jgi:biotin carboxylase
MAARSRLLHVLGGGLWQLPTIRLAKEMGYRVLVTDVYPQRPGYALADLHEVVDIRDAEGTLAVARRHRIDGIVCDTTDVGVPTAAYVAERLGLPGLGVDVARRFTSKYEMRQRTTMAGLQRTRFVLVRSERELEAAARHVGYPLVVKPIDNQSSRGVHKVEAPHRLRECFEAARRQTRAAGVLLEEFLPGREVTVEGLCLDGRYHTLAISDKEHYAHRPEVACRLTYPPAFPDEVTARIRRMNEDVVRALRLRNGITHAEYMVDGGRVALVEIAARGGGSLIHSHIVPHVSGIDAPRLYLRFLLGEPPELPAEPRHRAANLEFFDFPAGRVQAIHGIEEAKRLPGVAELLLEFRPGDVLKPPDDDRARPGLMVVLGETRSEVLATSARVRELVRVETA